MMPASFTFILIAATRVLSRRFFSEIGLTGECGMTDLRLAQTVPLVEVLLNDLPL